MNITIVGGGPAGTYASYLLSKKGEQVLLLDHKIPWEKSCGGGITWKAIKEFPFLQKTHLKPFEASELEFISPRGRDQLLLLKKPIFIFSRKELGLYLLKMAQGAGVHYRREKVQTITASSKGWEIITNQGSYKCNLLIGADGAQSFVRRFVGQKLSRDGLYFSLATLVKGDYGKRIIIKFVKDLKGYIWIFPRKESTSIGICSDVATFQPQRLKGILLQFLAEKFNGAFDKIKFKAAWIPVLSNRGDKSIKFCGEKWALIGDAASLADPITGEGIYYAFKSAQLLAESLKKDSFSEFPQLLKADFLPHLIKASQIKEKFFQPAFLERMLFLLTFSPSVREVVLQIIDGELNYGELKRRLLSKTFSIAGEIIIAFLSRLISGR